MQNLTKRILKDQLTTMLTILLLEGERQLSEAQTMQNSPYTHPYIKGPIMDKYVEDIQVLKSAANDIHAAVQKVLDM